MNPRDWPIVLVLFGLVVTGAVLMIGGLYSAYSVTPVDMPNSFDQISNVNADVIQMKDKISSSGTTNIGFLEYISNGAWQSLKLITNTIPLTTAVLEEAGTEFGIPNAFIYGFITLVSISVIFAIIGAIFRRKV